MATTSPRSTGSPACTIHSPRGIDAVALMRSPAASPATSVPIVSTPVAARTRGDGQPALRAALSAYNTGDFYRGFANGYYVAKYYGPGGVPALIGGMHEVATLKPAAPPPPNPYTADTAVFVGEATNVLIE